MVKIEIRTKNKKRKKTFMPLDLNEYADLFKVS